MDKQSTTSELRCRKCQAEPEGYSICLSYPTISTSTVCSAHTVSTRSTVFPYPYLQSCYLTKLFSQSRSGQVTLLLKTELRICPVTCILFISVHISHLLRSYWKSKQGSFNTLSTLPSLVQSAEVESLICLPLHISAGKFKVAVLQAWNPEPFQQPSDWKMMFLFSFLKPLQPSSSKQN